MQLGLDSRLSVWAEEPLAGRSWGFQADRQMPAASVIKLVIAWEALLALDLSARAEAGDPATLAAGEGVLRLLAPDTRLTWRELLTLMLVVSDNAATNLLIDRLGFDAVNARAASLGLTQTRLQRKMMEFGARQAGRENLMSAGDAGRLLSFLIQQAQSGSDEALWLLESLKAQQFTHKLPLLLEGLVTANKTGELPGIEHDAGVVWLPDGRPLVLAIFSQGWASRAEGCRAVAEAARAIVDAWG